MTTDYDHLVAWSVADVIRQVKMLPDPIDEVPAPAMMDRIVKVEDEARRCLHHLKCIEDEEFARACWDVAHSR